MGSTIRIERQGEGESHSESAARAKRKQPPLPSPVSNAEVRAAGEVGVSADGIHRLPLPGPVPRPGPGPGAGAAKIPGASRDPLWEQVLHRLGYHADRVRLRKSEVLRLIWEGKTYHEIALRLGRSAATVEAHWRAIKKDIGVRSHNELFHRISRIMSELAAERAAAEAAAPLLAEIEKLEQRVRELEERLREMEEEP